MAMLTACASQPSAMPNARYDLGALPAAATAANVAPAAPMPPVKVLAVSAPRNLETDSFGYRLSYVDAQRTGSYWNSHWTMPPAQLLTQRLRETLAARGPVLSGADPVRAVPLLEVELTRFEQVFDARDADAGRPRRRATQLNGERERAERGCGGRRESAVGRIGRRDRATERVARRFAMRRTVAVGP